MPDFSTAQVGDRVWSDRYGYGTISHIDPDRKRNNISVLFPDHEPKLPGTARNYYYMDGKESASDLTPDLHWDKPQFVEPPPPNRYVCEHGWVDCIDRETKKHFRRCFFCHEVEKPVALTREQIVQLMNVLGELLERKDMGND